MNTFNPFRKQVRYSDRNGVEKPLSQHTMLSGQWPFEKCPSACYLFKLLIVSEWSQRAKKLSVRVTCDTNQTQMSFLWFSSKAAFQASVTHWTQHLSYCNITANICHNCVTTLVTLQGKEGGTQVYLNLGIHCVILETLLLNRLWRKAKSQSVSHTQVSSTSNK